MVGRACTIQAVHPVLSGTRACSDTVTDPCQTLAFKAGGQRAHHIVVHMEADGAAGDAAGVLIALVRDVVAV